MQTLREFICYNQKQIIKFEYEISNLHKKFRICFEDKNSTDDEKSIAYEQLYIDSFMLMEEIFNANMKFIDNTFGLFDDNFRFTIKMINNKNVIDIFRNHEISNLFYETPYSSNSAFDSIMNKNKKLFYSDDLEKLFIEGKYKSPRLKECNIDLLITKQNTWKECWTDHNNENHINNNYYNSTLVIPMSITSDLNDHSAFATNYFSNNNEGIIKTQARSIWGFICFDSKDKEFFNNIRHFDYLDMGHIIADILSLYVVFFYNYTTNSNTIQQYENENHNDNKV